MPDARRRTATTRAPATVQEPRWAASLALWQLLAEAELANPWRRPINADLLECLLAPEVYAAGVDIEDSQAGRGMQPDPPAGRGPTYPVAPPPRVDDWHVEPVLLPWLRRYPTLAQLLDSRAGVDALYRWAAVPDTEADVYALWSAGFTAAAIGPLLVPPRTERTVVALIEAAEDRIHHALRHLDLVRQAEAM
jgi:hypothetical protein